MVTFVCEVYNPWATIGSIFKASKHAEDASELDELRKHLVDNASALIAKTKEKISVFRKTDGSYSYFKTMSCAVSQRAPAAVPRTNEGDVNSTNICCAGIVGHIFVMLKQEMIPFFTEADRMRYVAIIEEKERNNNEK